MTGMSERIASLTSIMKIRDQGLKERSVDLTRVRSELDAVSRQRMEIDKRRREECRVTMPEAMPYVAGFLDTLASKDARAAADEARLTAEVEYRREGVMAAWRDVRAVETVRETVMETARRASDLAESSASDERNLVAHAYRRATGGSVS